MPPIVDRLFLTARGFRVLDVVVVVWTIAWILLALAVAREVHGLRELSVTLVSAGVALQDTGRVVAQLDRLPFVGEDVARVGERAERAGRSARASGRSSRESIEELARLLGLAIGLVPTLPILAVYLPLRVGRIREVKAVRRELRVRGDDPGFREFLARRAADRIPYSRLRAIGGEPWRDLEAGRFDALADAELRRLGLARGRRR